MSRRPLRRRLAALAGLALLLFPISCGDDEPGTGPSGAAQVVGCSSVSYQGVTWSITGCMPGVASFQVSITQAGRSACFRVTCSAGCVATATPC